MCAISHEILLILINKSCLKTESRVANWQQSAWPQWVKLWLSTSKKDNHLFVLWYWVTCYSIDLIINDLISIAYVTDLIFNISEAQLEGYNMVVSCHENPFTMLALCEGKPPVACGFPTQKESNARFIPQASSINSVYPKIMPCLK